MIDFLFLIFVAILLVILAIVISGLPHDEIGNFLFVYVFVALPMYFYAIAINIRW